MVIKPANWQQLSSQEKRKLRLDHWEKSEGLQFASPEAEAAYRERIHRLRLAYDLAGPDRMVADPGMGVGHYALHRRGLNGHDILYNHEKLFDPVVEFNLEFQPDVAINAIAYPGKVMDMLDLRTYIWGGQKLPDGQVIQAVEGEYMMPDEYTDFIADPSGFWCKTYLPRMLGALGPMTLMPDWPRISEIVDVARVALPFGLPEVQDMLKRLMAAGTEVLNWMSVVGKIGSTLAASGFPSLSRAFLKAPFDFLGDTLRGTKGILMDMYRRPDDLLAACEAYVPILIKTIVQQCDSTGAPCAMYPLHKGADGFMSLKQFEKFYWPTLQAVMLGLYQEGIVNYLFVEGTYDSRLETIAQMPTGSCIWHFDRTDMHKVQEILSDRFPIAGNVPPSLMSTGSTEELAAYCDALVELYAGAPGFILAFGCSFEWTTDDKVRAFQDAVKK